MLTLSSASRVFVFTGVTDMRKSFNGLSGLVATHFDVELLSGHLFLFFNRRRDSVKLLLWDQDGLVIWYKRLEAGSFQVSALSETESSLEIDSTQLSLLLSGIDLSSAKRRKRFQTAPKTF
jgi:transposase